MLVATQVRTIKDNYCRIEITPRISGAIVPGSAVKTVQIIGNCAKSYNWYLIIDPIGLETLPSPRGPLPVRQAAGGVEDLIMVRGIDSSICRSQMFILFTHSSLSFPP